jgi:membrane associated rhomboid family serine protease
MIPLGDENPTRSFPVVTLSIIVINVLVFLYDKLIGWGAPEALIEYAMIPCTITNQCQYEVPPISPDWLTIFTSMFLHAGFLHLAGNMLYLWIFGNNVEDALGHVQFLLWYLVWGAAAALAHAWLNPSSQIPTVGASGAIAGALGAYFVLFPMARIRVLVFFFFITVIAVPAFVLLGFWFLMQFQFQPGVATMAHAGGFVAGAVTILVMGRQRVLRRLRRPRYVYYRSFPPDI